MAITQSNLESNQKEISISGFYISLKALPGWGKKNLKHSRYGGIYIKKNQKFI